MERIFKMKVPESCMPWIKLQRHGAKYSINKKEYIAEMEKEFKLMLPFLSKECNSILDIGCGIAGIDVLLSKHYDNPKLYLLDGDFKNPDIVYGFTKNTKSIYNSLLATKDMMEKNHISNYKILTLNSGLNLMENIDIIISTLSCGYHYPVDTYLEKINKILSKNGILIIDIRENTDGIKKIGKYFQYINIISNYNKSARICARRI